jgi:hypothetical protein
LKRPSRASRSRHEIAAEDADVIEEPEVWGVEALGAHGIVTVWHRGVPAGRAGDH